MFFWVVKSGNGVIAVLRAREVSAVKDMKVAGQRGGNRTHTYIRYVRFFPYR